MRISWRSIGWALNRFGPVAAVVATAAWSATVLRSPRARSGSAEAMGFSAVRAMRHVQVVASDRRPTGSPAARRVASYLLAQMDEMGFETEVQVDVAGHDLGPTPYGPRYMTAGHISNIIGRIRGTASGRAVLLMTHYDSVSQGYGANDAGVPIAAILEASRAFLRANQRPMNDLMVVFTDGEEAGLLGARAFFDNHPLAAEVSVVLNFEARGVSGPVLMFETGPGNGPILDHLARTGVPVFASSLFDAIYQHMPNATDFGVSRQKGIPGLNFAHIGGFGAYHGPLDDINHVDPNVLQHHGELALALVRRLCSADLSELKGRDSVFFPAVHGRLVRLPARSIRPLTAAVAVLWIGGLRRVAAIKPALRKRLALAGAMLVGRLVTGAVAGSIFTTVASVTAPEFRRHGDFHDSRDIFVGVVALAVISTLINGPDPSSRVAASTVLLAMVTAVMAYRLPGGSYLTLVPWLGGAVSLHLLDFTEMTTDRSISDVRQRFGATIAAVPAAAILIPFSRVLFTGLTPRMAGAVIVALQFVSELSAPLLFQVSRSVRSSGLIAASALATSIIVRRVSRREEDVLQPDSLSYLLAPENGEALWISSEKRPTVRSSKVLGNDPLRGRLPHYFPGWNREFLQAAAPLIDLPPPEVIFDEISDVSPERRRIRLRIRSLRGARQISVAVLGAEVYRWRILGGRWIDSDADPGESWELWLHSVPAEGTCVEVELFYQEARLRVLDRVDGLPAFFLNDPIIGPALRHRGPTYDAAALDVEMWGNASLVVSTINVPDRTESG